MYPSSLQASFSTHAAASASSQPIPIPGAVSPSTGASPESPAQKVRRVGAAHLAYGPHSSLASHGARADFNASATSPPSDGIKTAVFGVLDPNTPYLPLEQDWLAAQLQETDPMDQSSSSQQPALILAASSMSSFWDELESLDAETLPNEQEEGLGHSDEMQASPVSAETAVHEEMLSSTESGSLAAWRRDSSLGSGSFTSSLGTSREGQGPSSDQTIYSSTEANSPVSNSGPLAARRRFGPLQVEIEGGESFDGSRMEIRHKLSRGIRFTPEAWRLLRERHWEPSGLCDQLTLAWLEGSGLDRCSSTERAFLRSVHPVSFSSSILQPLKRLLEALGPASNSPQEPRAGWRPLYLSERFYLYCLQESLWKHPQAQQVLESELASYCLSRWLGLAWQASGSLRWPEMQVPVRGNLMRLTESLYREETLKRVRAGEPVGINLDPARVETGFLLSLMDEHEHWEKPLKTILKRVSLRGFVEQLPSDLSVEKTDEWLRRWEAVLPLLAVTPARSPLSLAALACMDPPAFSRFELLAKAALCVHGEVSWDEVVDQALQEAEAGPSGSENACEVACRKLSSPLNECLKQQGVMESSQRLRHLVEHPLVLFQHAGGHPEQIAQSLRSRGEGLILLISQFPWSFLAATRGNPELARCWQQMQLDELKCWLEFGWEAWSLRRAEESGQPHPLGSIQELAQQIPGIVPSTSTFSGWPPAEDTAGPILHALHQINQGNDPIYWSRLYRGVIRSAAEDLRRNAGN